MVLEGLVVSAFALTIFDAWLTRKRMHRYGINVELNYFIRMACHYAGIELGLVLAQLFPIACLLAILFDPKYTWVIAFLVGAKFKLFHTQLLSIVFEKRLLAAAAQINAQHSNNVRADGTPPPVPSSQSEELSQSALASSKDKDNESV